MTKGMLSIVTTSILATFAMATSEIGILKDQMAVMSSKIDALESKKQNSKEIIEVASISKEGTKVESKASLLKFSGKHYVGFVSDSEQDVNKFETRRNYFQVKGYFDENSKDYFRITLDTHHEESGDWKVRLKYAYLYLDNVLPFTGVEIGQAHRPWIDYEEHHGWYYRSISKVLVEDSQAAHYTNSSDLGVNFKTKMNYFSSELGIFNGEGYHGKTEKNKSLSSEWRLTGHLFSTGKDHVHKSDTYADISFLGQYNTDYKEKGEDFVWYGVHAVYNQEAFLVAAQYIQATDGGAAKEGKGWSVNGEFRVTQNWNLLGRYDAFALDTGTERRRTITGVAYKYNRNVEFILNYLNEEVDDTTLSNTIMLTAEVNW